MADEWAGIAGLAERAREGDGESFRALLTLHREAVSSTLVACGVRSPDTARDLAQDVALKAWTKLPTLDDPRAFPRWIRRIAANAARDHLRRTALRREEPLESAAHLAVSPEPDRGLEREDEVRCMLRLLGEEPEEVVELLVAWARGVPQAEIAERQGISTAALKMRLMRIRRRLRRRLEETS